MTFPDHFSDAADHYRRFRPEYPPELFDRLAALAPARRLCWDVATGSGQAARALAERFDRVIATDASADQLARAEPHPRIEYRVERAEGSSLDPASADLITVAAGIHWFEVEPFYAEVRRVARPGAVLAAWSYGTDIECDPAIDRVLGRYADAVLADYWSDHYQHVRRRYAALPFPFAELLMPDLAITVEWSLDQLLGAVGTWSASAIFRRRHGADPTAAIRGDLLGPWGDPATPRAVRIPLFFRVGRVD